MFHLTDAYYQEELPAKAKKLFKDTFNKYHKLDSANEDVALHMARKAIERNYVKLNNMWIPKVAAEHIVRHDIYDSEDESTSAPANAPHTASHLSYNDLDYDEDEDEYEYDDDINANNNTTANTTQRHYHDDDDDETDDDADDEDYIETSSQRF
ncbi:ac59-like protein [Cryptophlebia peltastica nucleopolyhedrovirus]|uniref:Ac59-like protein n=1 Tax=Cryptophlebia peltastica nucleopolyhedrovirus TaxID=2304025 RepID=A0A346RNR3_9ABAC|nr:ac59-like protein [Cryptophlebia peltastica nucleopolyhedrovirus]AXS67710.1 ac59-like protein [Cryptophlebia peltastica nucleopolyhedrovirus]